MTARDPYAVLGVDRSATDDEVRAAYRARSLLLHPDQHHGRPDHVRREADRAMAQLTDAYHAVLAERASRRGGASAPPGSGSPGSPGSPAGGTSAFRRLGQLAARSRTARLAAEAGTQDGGVAYRLGWLVGRRRSG